MYLGVDYYPEHWDEECVADDVKKMSQAGVNMVRIGEFAWHLMEPTEGNYDFSFFDRVIDKLAENNISVLFGTPTATFPAWLYKKHPGVILKDEQYAPVAFGGRRLYCYNSAVYNEYCEKIVQELVAHYANCENVVGWQIDNELGHEGSDMCYCENCHVAFQNWLKEKYYDINQLNQRWGTIFWGQTYNDFNEIPLPSKTITSHNPSLLLDHARFRSDSLNLFTAKQNAIINKFKNEKQFVTTNLPGGFYDKLFDHEKMFEKLDFVSYDNYPVWGGLKEPVPNYSNAASLDFVRGLKDQNFWIVEELIGAQGHNVIGYLPRPNQAKMWAYRAFAHGCDNMLFFRWRSMTKGAEQFCYGVLNHDNELGRKYEEMKQFFAEISEHEELVKGDIKSDIAIMYDHDNIWSWLIQKQSQTFSFDNELLRFYRPFFEMNACVDIVPSSRDFEKYKVIALPVMQLVDEKLVRRAEAFVKDGGTLLLSFRTGLKNRDNTIYNNKKLPGLFAKLSGIEVQEVEALQDSVSIEGVGPCQGINAQCDVWREILSPLTADVLFAYNSGVFKGSACVTKNKYGKGQVYYFGGGVGHEAISFISHDIIEKSGISHKISDSGLEFYERYCDGKKYLFCINNTEENLVYNEITFKPFECQVIKE